MVSFVAKCMACQQVKVENMRPGGLYQDIELPLWKWEVINIDFIIGIPRSQNQFDYIWVIIDRMTKSTHFQLVRTNFSVEDYANLYLHEIVKLHGVPISIISYHGTQFLSYFWRSFQKDLGTKVSLSIAFHPQSNGQVERTMQNWKICLDLA